MRFIYVKQGSNVKLKYNYLEVNLFEKKQNFKKKKNPQTYVLVMDSNYLFVCLEFIFEWKNLEEAITYLLFVMFVFLSFSDSGAVGKTQKTHIAWHALHCDFSLKIRISQNFPFFFICEIHNNHWDNKSRQTLIDLSHRTTPMFLLPLDNNRVIVNSFCDCFSKSMKWKITFCHHSVGFLQNML